MVILITKKNYHKKRIITITYSKTNTFLSILSKCTIKEKKLLDDTMYTIYYILCSYIANSRKKDVVFEVG